MGDIRIKNSLNFVQGSAEVESAERDQLRPGGDPGPSQGYAAAEYSWAERRRMKDAVRIIVVVRSQRIFFFTRLRCHMQLYPHLLALRVVFG